MYREVVKVVSFEEIYELYFKDVFYFVLSLSKNQHIAEDITQETFFQCFKKLS